MSKSLTPEDIRLLEKTISIRERILDNYLAKESLPTKPRDVESLTNLLESVDRSILSRAKITVQESANQINEEAKESLRHMLVEMHKTNNLTISINDIPSTVNIPSFSPSNIEVNEGELIRKIDNIDADSILSRT